MKHWFTILLCLAFTASVHADEAYASLNYHIAKDPRKWAPPLMTRESEAVSVLEGDSLSAWKELVSIKFDASTLSLQKYVDTWDGLLLKTDSKIKIKVEALGHDSMVVTFTSPSANETSIRRFFKGKDGIYTIAYHVRPEFKKDKNFKIWDGIIRTATLVRNSDGGEITRRGIPNAG